MARIWVSRVCGKHQKIIAASRDFDEADKLGQEFCKKNKTTFYIREYVELENLDQLLDMAIEMRQNLDLLIKKIEEAKK
jgi:hypothetical protein